MKNRFLMGKVAGFGLIAGILFGLPAKAEVIFDEANKKTLREFQLFLEGPLAVGERATLIHADGGFTSRPTSRGGFTVYKFAKLAKPNFNLRAVFEIPAGIRYSNSGIYLLYTDPTRPIVEELPARERSAYIEALENACSRSERYGPGPYEADFFARELQIIAGSEEGLPPENHGAGAFYGIPPVSGGEVPAGSQAVYPYALAIGDTYELTIEARGRRVKTYLRSVRHQPERVLVSEFLNVSRDQDPIRGGEPIALLLQAFPMNGRDTKGPVFSQLSVEQF